ncbi:MAG: hypothetical protein SCALA702_12510 [Melioribacteraceae bacterium]|nr:MAG: hypothetical protein SCALA702_12510 [Melioribacteraceae bacterium]
MFVVIYEFKAKPGLENEFIDAWYEVTRGIYTEMGSLGSRLHSTETAGKFIAYAQWPDRNVWQKETRFSNQSFVDASEKMKKTMESIKILHELDVLSDYLHDVKY